MTIRQTEYTPNEFVDAFVETALPSAIAASEYVDWESIDEKVTRFSGQLTELNELIETPAEEFEETIAALLVDSSNPHALLQVCFRLIGLGDSKSAFVVKDGVWELERTGNRLAHNDEDTAREVATLFTNLGLKQMLQTADTVEALLLGVEVGLESHSRKNRQGDCYEALLKAKLEELCITLAEDGYSLRLQDKCTIDYRTNDGSKHVDFALLRDRSPCVVFEANCYSAQGSKPSEIKRSYETVTRKMAADGIEYVWVTDGHAWKHDLKQILDKAYQSNPDLYNLAMVETELEADLRQFFEDGSRDFDPSELDPQSRIGEF